MKSTKEKGTFDLKNKLKEEIITKLRAKNSIKKDKFVEAYLEEYKQKAQARKMELMQYASMTN